LSYRRAAGLNQLGPPRRAKNGVPKKHRIFHKHWRKYIIGEEALEKICATHATKTMLRTASNRKQKKITLAEKA
jgi:hypothetical protein